VFGLCADQINNIYDALLAADIGIVSCRQESAALHMADGWARASGEPGVALVGGGPGFINSVTGFAVAQSAATPIIVISGQPPLDTRERNGHQILHQADIYLKLWLVVLEGQCPTSASNRSAFTRTGRSTIFPSTATAAPFAAFAASTMRLAQAISSGVGSKH